MKNIQFIFLVLGSAALLAACKVEDPLYCEKNEDCSEHAYCYKQVCVLTACKEDTDCLGGRICAKGLCQFDQKCESGQTRCDPESTANMQTCGDDGLWGEATGCSTGQLCGGVNPDSCGACNADQQCIAAPSYGSGFICVGGSCVQGNCHNHADCTEGSQTCGGGGVPNHCGGVCESGQTRCDPASTANMQTCGDDNLWGEATGCSAGQLCGGVNPDSCGACNADQQCVAAPSYGSGFICVAGSCVKGNCHNHADCTEGSQTCGGGGVPNHCGGVCKSGQTRCDPASSVKMQTCGNNGQWGAATGCSAGQLCGAVNPNSCGACNADQQCVAAPSYGSGFICVAGSCVQGNCHGDGDCKVRGQTCGGGGKANFCGGCTKPTDKEFCGTRNCGTVTEFDYCGNSRTVNCGECFGAQTCGGAGVSNMCGCPPPPHAPTEAATWPAISAAVPIPDSAYDFSSTPGEVLDKQTCLVWRRYPLGDSGTKEWERYNWESGKSACLGLGNGWRLPTKAELDSIVDHYKDKDHGNLSSPTINTKAFPDTPGNGFWTASESEGDSGSAWGVLFSNGSSYWRFQTGGYYVRCVR